MDVPRALFLLIAIHLFPHESSSESVITRHDDFGLSPIDPNLVDEIDWTRHACRRRCKDGAAPMECYYTFNLESYNTMSKACYDCPFNITDCFRRHCIPTDGIKRSILVVNRQLPGPPIEVCQGDRIIVDIINSLHSESTTMHWHGLHHLKTPYMDGVPYISQCPIPPKSTFQYDYVATEAGTHFWHSHLGFQRGDGVFGPLIVRVPPSLDWHKDLYDVDTFTLNIFDWTHQLGADMFLAHHHSDGDNKAPNILINGFGRFQSTRMDSQVSAIMPIETFVVKQSLRYRFRLINAEFLNCPIEVSVDNHTIYVVSSDGRDIEPVQAASLVSYAGERFDFIVEMDQEIDNYWIRFRGLMDCDERFLSAHQVAILRYEGAAEKDPESEVTYEHVLTDTIGLRVNALNEGMETNNSISIPLLTAMDKNDESNTREPDYQFYISYDFYPKDNPYFHRKNLYGFRQVNNTKKRVLTPQLNHISMKLPSFPVFSQRESINQNDFCNSSTVKGCEEEYCTCTHVLQAKLGSVVELILVDEGVAYDANHPFHIHGYQFRVVAMERLGKRVTVAEVKKRDAAGLIRRKLDRAPLKDTVTVPDGGYTILRFHANNPGYWLFHCHIEFHAEIGMSLVFKVGDHEDMVPVPRDFPRCGDWKPSSHAENEVSTSNNQSSKKKVPSTRYTSTPNPRENDIQGHNDLKLVLLKLLPSALREFHMATSSAISSSLAASLCLSIACVIVTVSHAFT